MKVVRPPSISRRIVVLFSARRKYRSSNPGLSAAAPFIGTTLYPGLLNSLNVARFGSIDLNLVAVAHEWRNVDDEAGLEFRGFHYGAGRRFLNALLGFDHGQVDSIGQQHANRLFVVIFDFYGEVGDQIVFRV